MAGWSQAIKVPVNQADDGPSGGWGNLNDRWDQWNSNHGEFTSLLPMIVLVQLFFTIDLKVSPDKSFCALKFLEIRIKPVKDAIFEFQAFQGRTKFQDRTKFQVKTEF